MARIATPDLARSMVFQAAIGVEEQTTIAGLHHSESGSARDGSCGRGGRDFSSHVRTNFRRLEENAGDFAVACALSRPVEGAQGKDEPVSASLRQRGRIGTGIAAGQASPEADRGGCADFEELVERKEDGGRLCVAVVDVRTRNKVPRRSMRYSGTVRPDAGMESEWRKL